MMLRLPMQPLSVGPAFGRLPAHTDEIPRSSKCRLLRVDRKCLNDATGEQASVTLPRQAVVSEYLGTRRCDMATTATQVVLDTPAAEFRLPATDGKTYALDDVAGEKGTVVVFICNHCPYVKAVIDRLVSDARALSSEGVGFAAICSNDAEAYPEDSFANMKRFAELHGLPFPYLYDEDQSVARAYGAVCTPDFFGYD